MAAVAKVTEKPQGKQWVVVKFGGTSVSYGDTWLQIVKRVKELQEGADGTSYNVLLVLSALTQVEFLHSSQHSERTAYGSAKRLNLFCR